jgi:plasmid maintenance system killer protein
MSSTFLQSISDHKSILDLSRTKRVWAGLSSALARTLEAICSAPEMAELDRYERERFERLIESLDRARRIRRNF